MIDNPIKVITPPDLELSSHNKRFLLIGNDNEWKNYFIDFIYYECVNEPVTIYHCPNENIEWLYNAYNLTNIVLANISSNNLNIVNLFIGKKCLCIFR